jgi:phage terminase large subunit-like protein
MPEPRDPFDRLGFAHPEVYAGVIGMMGESERRDFHREWQAWAHRGRRMERPDWKVWLMLTGRGFGKTRTGTEWVCAEARQNRGLRIALVAASIDEARAVMVEGESGILSLAPRGEIKSWFRNSGRLTWTSGARAFLYSGAAPERLRGPEHHIAWCDELAKWAHPEGTWNNLMLGMRLGEHPRVLVTTTPRSEPLLKRIRDAPGTMISRGKTGDNPFLPDSFVRTMNESYAGTRLGRQELDGELIEDLEGALWKRELIEQSRVEDTPEMVRVVIGVDPPAGASATSDACGIVAAGLGEDGVAYVLGDHSVCGMSPEGWAQAVAAAAARHEADCVIAEGNNGGKMVESLLLGAEESLPVRMVHASHGKVARAEPVAARFEKGKAKLAGIFPKLEDELAGLVIGGGYQGPGRSPDRADAMVWALTELLLRKRKVPRVSRL